MTIADTTGSGTAALAFVVVLVLFGVVASVLVLWILSIVDMIRRPDWQWHLAGRGRVMWMVLVILINVVAVYYWFWLRRDLQQVETAAARGLYGPGQMTVSGWQPGPAPGWSRPPGPQPGWPAASGPPPPVAATLPTPPGAPPAPGPPAGWFPDPGGQGGERWWDGVGWSTFTRP